MPIHLIDAREHIPVRVLETADGEVALTYNRFPFVRLSDASGSAAIQVYSREKGLMFEDDFRRLSISFDDTGESDAVQKTLTDVETLDALLRNLLRRVLGDYQREKGAHAEHQLRRTKTLPDRPIDDLSGYQLEEVVLNMLVLRKKARDEGSCAYG